VNDNRPPTTEEIEKLRVSTRERCDQLVLEIKERHAEIDALKLELGRRYDTYLRHRIEQREHLLGERIVPRNRTIPIVSGVESTFDNDLQGEGNE